MRRTLLLAMIGGLAWPAGADPKARVWEVNGIRLEASQVERLSEDIARTTVDAVRRVEGVELRDEQGEPLETIYYEGALLVYDDCVEIVNLEELGDAERERRIVDRVIEGQEQSTRLVAEVLDARQYAAYRAWEIEQVNEFKERGLWSRRQRGRRRRRR